MKDKSFSQAMNQIAALDDTRRRQEAVRLARLARREKRSRILASVLWVAMFGTAFYYHTELQEFVSKNFFQAPKIRIGGMGAGNGTNGIGTDARSTGQNLKFIQEQAAKREDVLNMTEAGSVRPSTPAAPATPKK